ncbi:MAG: DUF1566 domain-containing protein, partial [Proteobacteria bacterium]|nr:DUF1566 domain-containing protein [Pseudomonadota bacterium]
AKARAEAEAAARVEAEARAKAEEAERIKAAQIAKARAEAEAAARTEAVARAKAEEAERIKAAQIAKARAEAEAAAKAEEIERAKADAVAKAEAKKHEIKVTTAAIDSSAVSAKIVSSDGRFEKLISGVVRDTQSGLDWYAGPDKNTGWDDAKQWVAGLMVDGGGWRMPAMEELKGLYQKGAGSRNMTSLLETTGWLVWSGKTAAIASFDIRASALDFDDGTELADRQGNSNFKRGFAVRATPKLTTAAIDSSAVSAKIVSSDGRFEKLISGVVRDTQSGLDWYAGPDKDNSKNDANQWAAGLSIDGGGWRMPTRAELKGIYQKGAGSRNMTPLLETTGWLLWSGETGIGPGGGDVNAWAVDFGDGREVLERRNNSSYMRGFAVRSRR